MKYVVASRCPNEGGSVRDRGNERTQVLHPLEQAQHSGQARIHRQKRYLETFALPEASQQSLKLYGLSAHDVQ